MVVRLDGKRIGPRPPKKGVVEVGASEWDILRAYRNIGRAHFDCDPVELIKQKAWLRKFMAMPRIHGVRPAGWSYQDSKLVQLGKAVWEQRDYATGEITRQLMANSRGGCR